MHFDTKNHLKSNHNYTIKHTPKIKVNIFLGSMQLLKGFWDDEIIPCMH